MRHSPGRSPSKTRRFSPEGSLSPRRKLSEGWINDHMRTTSERRHQSLDGRSYSPGRTPHSEQQIPHSFGGGPMQAANKENNNNNENSFSTGDPIQSPELKDFLPDLCSILAGLCGCGCLTDLCGLLPKLCGLLPQLCGLIETGAAASENNSPVTSQRSEKTFRTEKHSVMVKENTVLVNKQKVLVRTQSSQDSESTPLLSNDEALEETLVTSIAVESSHSSSNTTVTSVQSSSSFDTNTSPCLGLFTTPAQQTGPASTNKVEEGSLCVTSAEVHADRVLALT